MDPRINVTSGSGNPALNKDQLTHYFTDYWTLFFFLSFWYLNEPKLYQHYDILNLFMMGLNTNFVPHHLLLAFLMFLKDFQSAFWALYKCFLNDFRLSSELWVILQRFSSDFWAIFERFSIYYQTIFERFSIYYQTILEQFLRNYRVPHERDV